MSVHLSELELMTALEEWVQKIVNQASTSQKIIVRESL